MCTWTHQCVGGFKSLCNRQPEINKLAFQWLVYYFGILGHDQARKAGRKAKAENRVLKGFSF